MTRKLWLVTAAIEIYFARSLGLALLTISFLAFALSGLVPLTTTTTQHDGPEQDQGREGDARAVYATPMLVITTVFHGLCAFYTYAWFSATSLAGFAVGTAGYGIAGFFGLWCVLFGGESRIKHGVDRRTSGFPFKNTEADKKKKVHVG